MNLTLRKLSGKFQGGASVPSGDKALIDSISYFLSPDFLNSDKKAPSGPLAEEAA
jgi:hypothetical protein